MPIGNVQTTMGEVVGYVWVPNEVYGRGPYGHKSYNMLLDTIYVVRYAIGHNICRTVCYWTQYMSYGGGELDSVRWAALAVR